jgi:hypothetical protein
MVAKTLLLSCLVFFPGQTAPEPLYQNQKDTPEPWYHNQRDFEIPIVIQADRQKEIDRLVLYVSEDEGQNWKEYMTVKASEKAFVFHAIKDGTYWYRVVAVNMRGAQDPDNPFKNPPDLVVVVDTQKPLIRIVSAERQGDEIVVRWEIQEDNPNTDTMKLQYQSKNSPSAFWSQVPVLPAPIGEKRFRVEGPNPILVRLQLQDMSKNQASEEKLVPGTITTAAYNGGSPTTPLVAAGPQFQDNLAPFHSDPVLPKAPVEKDEKPIAEIATQPDPNHESVAPAPNNANLAPITPPPSKGLPIASTQPQPAAGQSKDHVAALNPRKPLPTVQIVNNTRLNLKYQLNNVGPAGVDKVILYITHNDGNDWKEFAEDSSISHDPALGKTKQGTTFDRNVILPGEGVFGLTMRIYRRFDNRDLKPLPGEVPEMRIEVDQTLPDAVLFAPHRDPDQKDKLLISWNAKDRNLHPYPITLEWAKEPNGPWETIQTNLPNTGSYSWQIKPDMPAYAFLRLKVVDLARNESIAVTQEPQLIDLSEPEGRLLSATVVESKH